MIWISTLDPEERATVEGRSCILERRIGDGSWFVFMEWRCVSQEAAERIARCRGHLPPSETLRLVRTDAGPLLQDADGRELSVAEIEQILRSKIDREKAKKGLDPFSAGA